MNKIEVFKLDVNATVPTRNKATDCGMDIYASENIFIPIGATKIVKTGIAVNVPPGFIAKVEDRSSMAVKGLRTGAGVVDPGYSGSINIVLHNFSAETERDPVLFQSGYNIKKGDKIAQLVVYQVETPQIVEVSRLWESERGNNGFGSSGR